MTASPTSQPSTKRARRNAGMPLSPIQSYSGVPTTAGRGRARLAVHKDAKTPPPPSTPPPEVSPPKKAALGRLIERLRFGRRGQ